MRCKMQPSARSRLLSTSKSEDRFTVNRFLDDPDMQKISVEEEGCEQERENKMLTVSLNAQKYTLGGGVVMGWPFSKIKSSKHPIWLTNA